MAKEAEQRGAGEILLTSMDTDGMRNGFDCELTRAVSEAVQIPVIASGGAGSAAHFAEVFKAGKADAALAASIFHFGVTGFARALKAGVWRRPGFRCGFPAEGSASIVLEKQVSPLRRTMKPSCFGRDDTS